jgi:LCP family protein required for cell wall assembly
MKGMKFYISVFFISVFGFALIFAGVWHFFIEGAEINDELTAMPELDIDITLPGQESDENPIVDIEEPEKKSELEQLIELSDRVNFVVFGHDDGRADTIMFVSFDPTNQYLDILSIPRDTYWEVEGYTDRADRKKINAVYGFGNGNGGSQGLKQQIANLLQVPVHYYVKFDYDGAAEVVDAIGGVEINVPFDMKYDDTMAKPELHIDIKQGLQTLDGKNAVDYLRWRQNNDDIASEGDLPRIKRMQDFIRVAIKKSMSLKLPSVVNTSIKSVQTDIAANLAIAYADDAIGMSQEDISTYRLPGTAPARSMYYISDPEETEEMIKDIYRKGK